MSENFNDGGPAFPCPMSAQSHSNQDCAPFQGGMSKRELFAAILMHSEAVTCGVPGEACEALVEASREAGDDVIDHMAKNAVQGADALLRALGEPQSVEYRSLYVDEQARLDAAERLAAVVGDLKQDPAYPHIPAHLRQLLEKALEDITDPEIPF